MKSNQKIAAALLAACLFTVPTVLAVEPIAAQVDHIIADFAQTQKLQGACAVVYELPAGQLLATASVGCFMPNTVYEPGSVIKPLTLAAALERGIAKVDTAYSTVREDPKYYKLPGDGTHIWPEKMTLAEGVVRSSNILLGKLSVDVGVTNLIETYRAFGLASRGGKIRQADRFSRAEQSRLGIGQSLLSTPDEIARAYVVFANGGVSPWTNQRVISAATAASVGDVLKRVVSPEGTARRAALPDTCVAGKTGTAMAFVDGSYTNGVYNATFVGYFPAEKPRYVACVACRAERGVSTGNQGGNTSAVAFHDIAAALLHNIQTQKKGEQ